MRRLTALVALLGLLPTSGCDWVALGVNNAHHTTVERWTAARVPQRFRVRDAETGAPVPGARVVVMHNFDWMDDWVMDGTADADGVTTIPLAGEYMHLVRGHVSAGGYLTRDLSFGKPGTGRLADDPLDVYIYQAPEATAGLRVPADFRGMLVFQFGPANPDFPFPPDFPAGQRVWWTDATPGAETVVEPAPQLGFDPAGGANPFRIIDSTGRPIPTPEPGAEASGIAFWKIGRLEPGGPWGGVEPVTIIGDRADALAKAKEVWERHGNGPTGYVLNGWLRVLSPQTRLSGPRPDGVTRIGPDR